MDDWFSALAAGTDLSPDAAHALDERGFVVLPGPVPALQLERFALAYDAAVTAAASEDVHTGRTTTRVNDFVNRGAEFDALYFSPPLLGFIFMVDAFRPDNGATRFVPGSHRWPAAPGETEETSSDRTAAHADEVLACGPAGSLLIFHGSAWHGHSANVSPNPRRSLQGAFIPRTGRAATDFGARMGPDRRARLGPVARDVLAL
jgi:ectoine hydroxylase-related dioxygenase (phytanoyl-CoA dioxygenase family)